MSSGDRSRVGPASQRPAWRRSPALHSQAGGEAQGCGTGALSARGARARGVSAQTSSVTVSAASSAV